MIADAVAELRVPHSDDAERALVGSIMADEGALAWAVANVDREDFYREGHRRAFDAAASLCAAGVAVDQITLPSELARRGEFDACGGVPFISGLADAALVPAHIEHYARIVAEKAKQRELAGAFSDAAQLACEGRESAASIAERFVAGVQPIISAARTNAGPAFLDADAIASLPAPAFLVDGLLPLGGFSELHGPPGVGKSFIALAIAADVASGLSFCGHPVRERGRVVYVAGEGKSGLAVRLAAWREARAYRGPLALHFKTEPVQLLEASDVARFIADVRALETAPRLIVLDTLARCLVGGDENSAKDVGLAVAAIARIQAATGAAVLLIHHTRKDGEVERGSGALRGAVDSMIAVKADEAGVLRVTCEKSKDAAPFAPLSLQLVPIGESCAITSANERKLDGPRFTEDHRSALVALSQSFLREGASATAWLVASDLKEKAFYNVRTALVTWDYVQKGDGLRGLYTVTDAGRALIASIASQSLPTPAGSDAQSLPSNPGPLGAGRIGRKGDTERLTVRTAQAASREIA